MNWRARPVGSRSELVRFLQGSSRQKRILLGNPIHAGRKSIHDLGKMFSQELLELRGASTDFSQHLPQSGSIGRNSLLRSRERSDYFQSE